MDKNVGAGQNQALKKKHSVLGYNTKVAKTGPGIYPWDCETFDDDDDDDVDRISGWIPCSLLLLPQTPVLSVQNKSIVNVYKGISSDHCPCVIYVMERWEKEKVLLKNPEKQISLVLDFFQKTSSFPFKKKLLSWHFFQRKKLRRATESFQWQL